MRINARLNDELAPKIQYLTKVTGLNLSEVVKEAVKHFYDLVRSRNIDSLRAFKKAGFVGVGRAEADLSENYKRHLSKSLNRKL